MKEIAAALVAATEAVRAVEKRGDNTHDRYRYATADDVVRAATAALRANGLTVVPTTSEVHSRAQTIKIDRAQKDVSTLILQRGFLVLHTSGESIEASMSWPIVVRAADSGKGAAAAETTCYSYYLKTLLDMSRDPNDDIDRDQPPVSGANAMQSAVPMGALMQSQKGAALIGRVRSIDNPENLKLADKHISELFAKLDAGLDVGMPRSDLESVRDALEIKR